MNLKMFTISLVLIVLSLNSAFSKNPTQEMLKSEIICGNIASGLTLENLENNLKQKGNVITYEIYDNNDVILIAKITDNLNKKIIELKIQFEFVPNKVSVLFLKKGSSGKDNFTADELCNQMIMPLGNQAMEDANTKREIEEDNLYNKFVGKYKGYIIETGKDKKIEIELSLTYTPKGHSALSAPGSGFEGQLIYDGAKLNLEWTYKNNKFDIIAETETHYDNVDWYQVHLIANITDKLESGIAKTKIINADHPIIRIIKMITFIDKFANPLDKESVAEGTFQLVKQ